MTTAGDGASVRVEGVDCVVPPETAARLNAVPVFTGRHLRVRELSGGLTNTNYRVDSDDGGTYVARLSSAESGLLAIDRECEHAASIGAASTGVAPKVAGYLPDGGVLVIEWVTGRTLSDEDLLDVGTLRRVASSVRRLHAGPAFPRVFDMFDIQQRYLAVVQERGFRLPERYLDFAPQVERIRQALAVRAQPRVPCNNDLLAANLIDDGDQIWVIDYEYAGNNDACFELGNIWSEANLPVGHLDVLVDAYYGTHLRHKVARARLHGLMAKYGWMLWASIQDGVSSLDFDFWSWGLEKYERAVAEFDGPDLEVLLSEAVRDD